MFKKTLFGLVTFCLLFTAISALNVNVLAQSKKDVKQAKKLVDEGDKRFNSRQYEQAIAKYAEALVLVNNHPYAHFWKGNAHYYLKQYDLALEEFNTAQRQGFQPVQNIYKVRWYIQLQKKNYEEALSDVQVALESEPESLLLLSGLGDIYYNLGKYQEAVAVYERIVDRLPSRGNVYYYMSLAYSSLGETSKQREAAQNAINNGTEFMPQAFIKVAEADHRNGDLVKAAEAYERSLKLRTDIYEVYRVLSDIYRNQNKYNSAIETTKKGLMQFPQDANLYVDLSWYFSLAGQPGEAIGAAERAIAFDRNQYMAHTNLCRGNLDAAARENEQRPANEPKKQEEDRNKRIAKYYETAITACNEALVLKPDDGETYFYLGRANDLLGKTAVATGHYKKALTGLLKYTVINPLNPDGFYLLGNAYFANGDRPDAIAAYQKCLELSPLFSKARFNLGYIYHLMGKDALAQDQYMALLTLDADLAGRLKQAMSK